MRIEILGERSLVQNVNIQMTPSGMHVCATVQDRALHVYRTGCSMDFMPSGGGQPHAMDVISVESEAGRAEIFIIAETPEEDAHFKAIHYEAREKDQFMLLYAPYAAVTGTRVIANLANWS